MNTLQYIWSKSPELAKLTSATTLLLLGATACSSGSANTVDDSKSSSDRTTRVDIDGGAISIVYDLDTGTRIIEHPNSYGSDSSDFSGVSILEWCDNGHRYSQTEDRAGHGTGDLVISPTLDPACADNELTPDED